MIESEQIKLFNKIRKRFKHRTKKWCSGYLHGVLDEVKRKIPRKEYRNERVQYNSGYMFGFIDARGTDVKCEKWLQQFEKRIGYGVKVESWWWRK